MSVKSNTPCRPGLTPVAQVVHAGKVAGGMVLRSGSSVPDRASARRFGSAPSSIHRAANTESAPSKPMISILAMGEL